MPGSAVDARDRIVEAVRLHGHEQEIDRLFEPFVGLEPLEMLVVVGCERQPVPRDRGGRFRLRDAHDALSGTRHPHAERTAYRAGTEDGDGHALAGSAMRFTYFHSE